MNLTPAELEALDDLNNGPRNIRVVSTIQSTFQAPDLSDNVLVSIMMPPGEYPIGTRVIVTFEETP